ncbi:U6 small nuclear RNA (adenine-(43)-N(6))-methyltransferase [Diorhabda carinulata]|uniref:U6 small nuclear RNA (adenine-(43)-N(6))-methyltransferase n=1 Tax=Diorhabda carinulata TaxID=1163345 RepID=UPI0025A04079|nr:U6 small nuclear RNA (adenine-(43)-N(6))-methyltransferase [Diorhabda carinulata]
MSMNKYMHPKNIYKSPPNFKQLALDYPEFREFVTQDITGKVGLDFKNIKALRALSCILLKKDFGLDVEIPLDKLIPTIPLRLNYILWLEDLLTLTGNTEAIKGVDIGTGASCVYPLIAAKKNKWQMLASEVDNNNYIYAKNNIEKNDLQDLIEVVKVEENVILKNLIKDDKYDFCMCNPPFFGSTKELRSNANSRNLNRPKPKNSFCASTVEVVVKGGEVDFISKLIQESKILETNVKIYTTMVGHKKSLPELKKLLREVEVSSFKETEFCQGNTTRWGLAWTFITNLDLKKCLDPIKLVTKPKKNKDPLTYIFPFSEVDELSLNKARDCIIKLFEGLEMVLQEVSRQKNVIRYFVTAYANTWSNQRRKRRERLRNSIDNSSSVSENNNECEDNNEIIDKEAKSPGKRTNEDHIEGAFVKKLKISGDEGGAIFFKFIVSLKLHDDTIILEIDCLESYNNRDYLHQILQYIKNHLET